MTDLPFPDWAVSAVDARFTAPIEIRSKRTMFEKRIRRRNFVEYTAGVSLVLAFGWIAWLTADAGEYMVSASWLSLVLSTTVVMLNLRRVASLLVYNPAEDCRSHLRAQLAHQHSALSSVSRWYIAPFVPGMMFVFLAMAEFASGKIGWAIALGSMVVPALLVVGVFWIVIWLNRHAAAKLADEIAALDDLAGPA